MAMAVEVYPECIVGISPRISFSHDFKEAETIPIETYPCRHDSSLLDSSSFDFAFTIDDSSISHESSTADELFYNGKILPIDIIRKESIPEKQPVLLHQKESLCLVTRMETSNPNSNANKKSLREYLADTESNDDQKPNKPFWKFRRSTSLNRDNRPSSSRGLFGSLKTLSRSRSTGESLAKGIEEDKPMAKPFWKFKRSQSLNSDSESSNRGLIGSLKMFLRTSNLATEIPDEEQKPASKSFKHFGRSTSLNCENNGNGGLIGSLYFLSRSNSTGSVPSPTHQRQHSVKKAAVVNGSPSSPSSNMHYPSTQKGQFKKNCGSYYGTSTRVSPILNIPSPYISRISVDLFGFGSLFCNGKVRKKRK
ncbi:hypothetical protein Ancab_018514 [Ancistrocladus abbreviatus]